MGKEAKVPKILIAEDEDDLRELYALRLETESFKLVSAKDGEEAIEKTKKEMPDLILLDIMMPKKSGLEVLKELRKDPQTKKTPVIVLTALSSSKLEKEALSLGADKYLVKAEALTSDIVGLIKKTLS